MICSDYGENDASPTSGRYRLRDLLAAAAACPGARKLLVLDTSHFLASPRGQMLANQFPLLLQQEVGRLPPQNLWVLASCRPFEVEHYSAAERRSVFGYFLTEGLRGDADGFSRGRRPRDGTVDLDELTTFVHDNVADWVAKQSKGLESQTPCLLHAGEKAPVWRPPAAFPCAAPSRSRPPAPPVTRRRKRRPSTRHS